jgi:hypothetical protein
VTFSHSTGAYNVEASIIAWLNLVIVANAAPLIGAPVPLVVDYPQTPLAPPCYAATSLGGGPTAQQFEGARLDPGKNGTMRWAMLQVDCWDTRRNNPAYRARLIQLGDVLTFGYATALKAGGSLPIYDFYSSASAPVALAYRIYLDRFDESIPAPDPNPDLVRRRFVLLYRWLERI